MKLPEIPNFDMDFSPENMAFSQTPCEVEGIGHDEDDPMVGYDLAGTISIICGRPWCSEVIRTVAVDDLSREKADELYGALQNIADRYDL